MSPKTYPVHGKLPVAQLGVLGAAFVAGVLCSSLVLRSIPGTFDKLFVSRSSNPSTASLENSGAGQVPAEAGTIDAREDTGEDTSQLEQDFTLLEAESARAALGRFNAAGESVPQLEGRVDFKGSGNLEGSVESGVLKESGSPTLDDAGIVETEGALGLESSNPGKSDATQAFAALSDSAAVTGDLGTQKTPIVPEGSANSKIVSYRLQSGDTLLKIWYRVGAVRLGAIKAGDALKAAGISVNLLKAGDELSLTLSTSTEAVRGAAEVTRLERRFRTGKILLIEGDSKQGYRASLTDAVVQEAPKQLSGTITSSFAEAAQRASVPYDVVDELVDLFSARVEFGRSLQVGDTFTVSFKERRADDGSLLDSGEILSASLESNGKLIAAIRHLGTDRQARYYDEQGNLIGNYFLRYPLKFSRISSTFSHSRFHPVLKVKRPHNGVDFAAPIGTPVRSVADGVVQVAGYKGAGGKTIIIRHCDRYSTAYLHLANFAPGLRTGAVVKRGQTIGAVGMTGLSTGAHLHYSLYDRGRYVDPMRASLPSLSNDAEKIPPQVLYAQLEGMRREHKVRAYAFAASQNRRG